MINLLATGLISLCLLSPAQSPDCAGGVGVSVTPPSISLPHVSVPPLPVGPIVNPAPLPPVVVPAPVPAAPTPMPPSVTPPHQVTPAAPAPLQPPAPTTQPVPAPQPHEHAVSVPTPVGAVEKPTPRASAHVKAVDPAPARTADHKPAFLLPLPDDGSVGAAIVNTAVRFPDLTLLLTVLAGLGIIVLNEKLDTTPSPRRVPRHSSKTK